MTPPQHGPEQLQISGAETGLGQNGQEEGSSIVGTIREKAQKKDVKNGKKPAKTPSIYRRLRNSYSGKK